MSDWPEEDNIIARFRDWLEEARGEADAIATESEPFDPDTEVHAVGLSRVVEELTALRHELKLQTKSARGLEQQNEAMLEAMGQAIDRFGAVGAKESEAARGAAKPLIEALIDLDESLERGALVIETARSRIVEDADRELRTKLGDRFRRQTWWRRWIGRSWHESTLTLCHRHSVEVHRGIFDSLLEGYELIRKRLKRAMAEERILRIASVGKPADPNCMTVVDVVESVDHPAGFVVEELRPGYFWKDKVVRFAEVRAVVSQPTRRAEADRNDDDSN